MSVTRRGLDKSVFSRYASGEVKAGVLADATYPADTLTNAKTGAKAPDPRAGMKVATIAAALHYGVGQNHPRPFIAQAVAKHKKEWADGLVKLAVSGVAPLVALTTIGQVMAEDIQDEIQAWPADNSKAWAEYKGFNHGLVLTGHLTNSIKSEAKTT
jgi:hypothetical protein